MAVWLNRPLEATNSLVFFDALRVKIHDKGSYGVLVDINFDSYDTFLK